MSIRYLVPTQEADTVPAGLAPRLASLNGITLGILSNGKSNATLLLEMVGEEMVADYGVAAVVIELKQSAVSNCPAALLDRLASQADAVITAIGD
jgi:hypothetical protein